VAAAVDDDRGDGYSLGLRRLDGLGDEPLGGGEVDVAHAMLLCARCLEPDTDRVARRR
jgi:hypothetical protein